MADDELAKKVDELDRSVDRVGRQVQEIAAALARLVTQLASLESNLGIIARANEAEHRNNREFRDIVNRRFDTLADSIQAVADHFPVYERASNASNERAAAETRARLDALREQVEALPRAVAEVVVELRE